MPLSSAPVTLATVRRTKKLPSPGTPMLTTQKELVAFFRGSIYRDRTPPRGTPGLMLLPLGGGIFGAYATCYSTRDEECWIDPRSGRCLCKPRAGAGGGGGTLPLVPCRFDFASFACWGQCRSGTTCQLAFAFVGAARGTAHALPTSSRTKLAQALTATTSLSSPLASWRIRLFLSCSCI